MPFTRSVTVGLHKKVCDLKAKGHSLQSILNREGTPSANMEEKIVSIYYGDATIIPIPDDVKEILSTLEQLEEQFKNTQRLHAPTYLEHTDKIRKLIENIDFQAKEGTKINKPAKAK